MIRIGIRFKFILFTSLLTTLIGMASIWYFSAQTKKQLEEELKKRGYSLIVQLAQDGEIKDTMSIVQKAFFEEPIRRLRNLDIEKELAYWRVSLVPDYILLEDKESWIETEIDNIPVYHDIENVTEPSFTILLTNSGEKFYNFTVPVYEKHTITEEEFATQIFGLGNKDDETTNKRLGSVQIGLTPKRINEKMKVVLWTSSIPLGFIIILVGTGASYFIARSVVKPIVTLVKITDSVASGDLEHIVEIKSGDEIGMLASRFNQMTKGLKQLMNEKENVMTELKGLNKELSLINTELLRTNEQLREAQERLLRTEKLAAVGTLASGVSHELRNPLGAIKNAVFFLKGKLSKAKLPDLDARVVQFLDIMDDEIDRSSRIINDLLGFARVATLTKNPADITTVVNTAISRIEIAKNVKVTKNFQSNLPMVMIDAIRVEQVFMNMIENACQAMPDGGELQISTRELKEFIEIKITDSGFGIPEKTIKKIFDPLFTTKSKGTGMGLAVCHGIIEKHNGTIDVKSQEGIGTSMIIRLPLEGNGAGPS